MTKLGWTTLALASAATIAIAAPASAEVITFEDVGNVSTIPNGYKGLNWNNFGVIDGSRAYTNSGYENGVVSGTKTAYNSFAGTATISSSNAFNLESGFFTGAWNNGLTVTALGFVNGVQAFNTSFVVNATGPVQHVFNWTNLSSVQFSSAGGTNAGLSSTGTHFVLDNLSVNSAVPEPATWAMMMLGFGGMGFALRRRRMDQVRVRFA